MPFVKAAATSALTFLNKTFTTLYCNSFTQILPKVSGVNLTPRKDKIHKKWHLRREHQEIKRSLEKTLKLNGRDVETLYRTQMSGSSHDK